MFHRRCDKRIAFLERLLDEEREKNLALQEQLMIVVDKPVVRVGNGGPANVYYMDDMRVQEMEADGELPT